MTRLYTKLLQRGSLRMKSRSGRDASHLEVSPTDWRCIISGNMCATRVVFFGMGETRRVERAERGPVAQAARQAVWTRRRRRRRRMRRRGFICDSH